MWMIALQACACVWWLLLACMSKDMDVHACLIAVVERIQFVFPMQVVPVLTDLKAYDIIFVT